MIRKSLLFTSMAALACALAIPSNAGTRNWNFDDWYSSAGGVSPWVMELGYASSDGQTVQGYTYIQTVDGNPSSGGYLQLTPAAAGRNLCVVFPDIDEGAPVKAFKITMDVRAGNGLERPADGFSISYVRETDPALSNATQVVVVDPIIIGDFILPGGGNMFGFGGGDSAAQTLSDLGSGNSESGSKSGVSISFDAWAGNWLPDTGTGGVPGPDIEGIIVRVDDKTLTRVPLTQRNAPGFCMDTNSMQTGPYDGSLSYSVLEWCQLEVEKTADNKVNVTWKGRKILDGYQLTDYSVHRGRLMLAGRTGDNHQHVHFDNIVLETTPAIEPTLETVTIASDFKGLTFTLRDTPPSTVSAVTQVLLNGVDITANVGTSYNAPLTTGTYTQATRFAPGSVQRLTITFETTLGQTLTVLGQATTPSYFPMPTAYKLTDAAVAGQARGIALGQAWQTIAQNINSLGDNKLNWTEEQILGLWGPNLVTTTTPASANVIDYQNESDTGFTPGNGNFRLTGSTQVPPLWDGPDINITEAFGIGSNPDKLNTEDGTIEWFAYVKFPAAGNYTMVVNSDDGFRLTTARHIRDRMGDVISYFDAGRGNGTGAGAGTQQTIVIDEPGIYPIRGLIFNRGGGFNVEWYTRVGDQLYLVNGAGGLEAWVQAVGRGAYVQSAIPVRSAVDVAPSQPIQITLANGSPATVNAGTIALTVDGQPVTPNVAGLVITQNPVGPNGIWTPGVHTIGLTFNDSVGAAYSYAWSFTVVPYGLLSDGFPLGSEDTTQPGFKFRIWQTEHTDDTLWGGSNKVGPSDNDNEQLLAGYVRPNVADLSSAVNGVINVASIINWSSDGSAQGNFQTGNGYPDGPVPGIPGVGNVTVARAEHYSGEFLTYLVFPSAGLYGLGVNSDDGFKVTAGHARPVNTGALLVSAPASVAGGYFARQADGAAAPVPVAPVSGKLVPTDPILADTPLNNAAAIAGNIAICRRGAVEFSTKIKNAFDAGAIAVIVVNNQDDTTAAGPIPIVMGAGAVGFQPIPASMIMLQAGDALIAAAATGDVMATLTPRQSQQGALGIFDGGRGASDTRFFVYVDQPGVYPIRLFWYEGGGGDNVEFFSFTGTGTVLRTLVNDTVPGALKAYRALKPNVAPTVSISADGGTVTISFSGTLQSADHAEGPYTDVPAAASPLVVPASGMKFYRSRL